MFRLTILWNNELDISAKRLRTVAASPTDCQLLGKTLSCVTLLLRFVYSVRYQTDRQTESNLLEVIATHIHTHAQREREREWLRCSGFIYVRSRTVLLPIQQCCVY